jgi:protocatechuate 3,4-dioxygenase beta subunit
MKTRAFGRREALGTMGTAGAALLLGCGGGSPTSPGDSGTPAASPTSTNGACAVTPSETAGPFPSLQQFFRSDIREGKPGSVLALTILVVNATSACAPVSGASVEIWHVDAAGNYSEYGTQTAETYLRGIQTTSPAGTVLFTTIYPGWYQGRATHIHVEVKISGVSRKVTQIAFPESINATVHRTGAYAARGPNPMSNGADGIFADSLSSEIVTPTGDPTSGYAATFQVAVAV